MFNPRPTAVEPLKQEHLEHEGQQPVAHKDLKGLPQGEGVVAPEMGIVSKWPRSKTISAPPFIVATPKAPVLRSHFSEAHDLLALQQRCQSRLRQAQDQDLPKALAMQRIHGVGYSTAQLKEYPTPLNAALAELWRSLTPPAQTCSTTATPRDLQTSLLYSTTIQLVQTI